MKRSFFLLLLLFSLAWSCRKDFIVEDISKKTLSINSPSDNTVTTLNLVSFWWDELDGAEQYNLQIVKPDFSKAVQLLLDTNVTSNKFNFSLKPGTYQWRIKAKNAGHSTAFQTFNIRIDTTSDLTEQLVNLLSPVNGAVTGNKVVTFNWNGITSAKKYRLQINNGEVLDTTLVGKTSLTRTLVAAANATTAFTWNVKAINESSESQFNASPFTLTVDRKGPGTPGLIAPLHMTTLAITDSLKWTRSTDAVYDSVFVADDSSFVNYQQLRVNAGFIEVQEFNLAPSQVGTYYWWKVRSFDLFGNPSSYSIRRKFKISP